MSLAWSHEWERQVEKRTSLVVYNLCMKYLHTGMDLEYPVRMWQMTHSSGWHRTFLGVTGNDRSLNVEVQPRCNPQERHFDAFFCCVYFRPILMNSVWRGTVLDLSELWDLVFEFFVSAGHRLVPLLSQFEIRMGDLCFCFLSSDALYVSNAGRLVYNWLTGRSPSQL